MIDWEMVSEFMIGFGAELVEAGIDYLDDLVKTKGAPVLKRASTWGNIAACLITSFFSEYALTGKARTLARVVAGGFGGEAAKKILVAVAEGEPVWGEKKSEVTVTFEELEKGSLEIEEAKEETKEETTETVEELPGQAL